MSPTSEMIAFWLAIAAYAVSTVAFAVSVWFARPRAGTVALAAAGLGAFAQLVAISLRWLRIGHGPFLGFFELAPLAAMFAVVGFLWLVWRFRGLAVGGVALMPVALLILGASLLADKQAQVVGPNLASVWLVVHVIFANLAYGAYSAAFVLSVAFLLKNGGRSGERLSAMLARFPQPDELDSLNFRLVGAGFVFQSVMLASGAIWANEAWGRYWGWDPIETWSLIAWAVYALYLHLMLTLGWRGRRAAWVGVIALPVILFSILGVPVVYHSIHGAYLKL